MANVVENNQPLIGDAITGEGPGLLMVVEKFPSANTLDVTRDIEKAFTELAPGLPGITVDTEVYRPADYIEISISNVRRATIIGFILLAIVLVAYFYDVRAALICLAAISLSLVTACLVLYLTGATFNMNVLTGFVSAIAVAAYVAIIDVDNVVRSLRNRTDRSLEATAPVVLGASQHLRRAIAYAAPIMLLAIAPILFMGGTPEAYFRPFAISYGLAIVATMVVMLTVTPALCLTFLAREKAAVSETPRFSGLQLYYERALNCTFRHSRLAIVATAGSVVACLVLLPIFSGSPLPNFKELSLLIHLKAVPGTSQPEMSRIAGRMRDELRQVQGVRNVGAHVGRAILGDQVVDVNSAELWVSIDPKADYTNTAGIIKKVVEAYPGLGYSVQTYLRKKSRDIIQEPEDSVVVRIYGDRYDVLGATAEDVSSAIQGIDGIQEVKVKTPLREATLETEVDLAKAQKHGLKPGDIRRAAACLLSGIQVVLCMKIRRFSM